MFATAKSRRHLLIDRDLTITALARAAGVSRSMASLAISDKVATPHVRRAIAAALKLPFETLWGVPDPGIDRLPPGRKCLTDVNHSGEQGAPDEIDAFTPPTALP